MNFWLLLVIKLGLIVGVVVMPLVLVLIFACELQGILVPPSRPHPEENLVATIPAGITLHTDDTVLYFVLKRWQKSSRSMPLSISHTLYASGSLQPCGANHIG